MGFASNYGVRYDAVSVSWRRLRLLYAEISLKIRNETVSIGFRFDSMEEARAYAEKEATRLCRWYEYPVQYEV